MTLPDASSLKELDAPTDKGQIRGAILTVGVGVFMMVLALAFHGLAPVGGLGGAFLALGIQSLLRTRRFSWWQIALIVFGAIAAAAIVVLLSLVAIELIRSRH
jgi:hypothetical protein